MDKATLRLRRAELKRELAKIEDDLLKPNLGHQFLCHCVDCGGCKQQNCDKYTEHDSGYCEFHRCHSCNRVGITGHIDGTAFCSRCIKKLINQDSW